MHFERVTLGHVLFEFTAPGEVSNKSQEVTFWRQRTPARVAHDSYQWSADMSPANLYEATVVLRYSWRTSVSILLVSPTRRSTLGDRAFSIATTQVWNGLPQSHLFRVNFDWLITQQHICIAVCSFLHHSKKISCLTMHGASAALLVWRHLKCLTFTLTLTTSADKEYLTSTNIHYNGYFPYQNYWY